MSIESCPKWWLNKYRHICAHKERESDRDREKIYISWYICWNKIWCKAKKKKTWYLTRSGHWGGWACRSEHAFCWGLTGVPWRCDDATPLALAVSGSGENRIHLVNRLTANVYFYNQPCTKSNNVAFVYTFNVNGIDAWWRSSAAIVIVSIGRKVES